MYSQKDFTIVIADDHPLILKGLYEELLRNKYNVVAKAEDGKNALERIREHHPDVALLDIDMPKKTGFEIAEAIKQEGLETKIVILSFHKEYEFVAKAKQLKIDGYLLKEDPFHEIERCMHTVLSGQQCFSPSFSDSVLADASLESEKMNQLTPSEKTILKLVAEKKTNKEIAEELFISARTVEKHRSNIINKLELRNETKSLINWVHSNKKFIKAL